MKKMRKAMGIVLAGSILLMTACANAGTENSNSAENNSGGGR